MASLKQIGMVAMTWNAMRVRVIATTIPNVPVILSVEKTIALKTTPVKKVIGLLVPIVVQLHRKIRPFSDIQCIFKSYTKGIFLFDMLL